MFYIFVYAYKDKLRQYRQNPTRIEEYKFIIMNLIDFLYCESDRFTSFLSEDVMPKTGNTISDLDSLRLDWYSHAINCLQARDKSIIDLFGRSFYKVHDRLLENNSLPYMWEVIESKLRGHIAS